MNTDDRIKIYDLFIEQANQQPQEAAITEASQTISYQELKTLVEVFSNLLYSSNVAMHLPIGIILTPSIDFIVAVFACQKLGYPYIPIDYTHPDHYITEILKDANVLYIISNTSFLNRLNNLHLTNFHFIDIKNSSSLPKIDITQFATNNINRVAYIIYTSGSTGQPKGVEIQYNSLVNLILETRKIYRISNGDRIPLFHSLGFDVSIWEIFSTLLNGAHLIIPPDINTKRSPLDYLQFLIDTNITIANMTPSYFYLFNTALLNSIEKANITLKLRLILLAGEPFHTKKINSWFQHELNKKIDIYNMYGITEATIHSTFLKITPNMMQTDASLIGNPLPGVELAIVNEKHEVVRLEEVGELCISGISISSGYLGQSSLNQTKYLHANLDNTTLKRWLLTGDIVNRTSDGLEYIGRKDKLIKIRGYRINLSQIENLLCSYPNVDGALVTAFTISDDIQRLVAFIRTRSRELKETTISCMLKQTLPEYMCPTKFILVDAFPLTKNGKIDVNQLISEYLPQSPLIADNTKLTTLSTFEKVKSAWLATLNLQEVKPEINFFDAGGDSLLLAKLQFFLQTTLNIEIKMLELLQYPTIETLAQFLQSRQIYP